jgi:hypothetical protein
MNHWQRIFDYISLPTTNIIYIGVGSSMGDYQEITTKNNQQYPCFLNKFAGKHLVILIDPYMETNLKLLNYFEELNDPLILQNQINITNTTNPYIREYTNDKGLFFIMNDCFYSDVNQYMEQNEIEQANHHIAIMHQIISIALGKISPSKIIFQNYSGYDTTTYYLSLFDVFNHDQLLSNVCFDVTQHNGGCFIDFDPNMITLDKNINFIQEKYELLVNFPDSQYYLKNLKTRIDLLSYPLVWNYINLKKSIDFERVSNSNDSHYLFNRVSNSNDSHYLFNRVSNSNDSHYLFNRVSNSNDSHYLFNRVSNSNDSHYLFNRVSNSNDSHYLFNRVLVHKIKFLAIIYKIEYDLSNNNYNYILNCYYNIIYCVITDIVRSRRIPDEFIEYLITNLENRFEFTNLMSILKFE